MFLYTETFYTCISHLDTNRLSFAPNNFFSVYANFFFFLFGRRRGGCLHHTAMLGGVTPGATYRVQQEQIYLNKETILVYIEKMILYKH